MQYSRQLVLSETASADLVKSIRAGLQQLPDFRMLSRAKQTALVEGLAEAMCQSPAVGKLRANATTNSAGRKPSWDKTVLVADIARVLRNVTGDPVKAWQSGENESLPVEIARICLGILQGLKGPYSRDLKRQARNASKIVIDSGTNL